MKPIFINANGRIVDIRHTTEEERYTYYANCQTGLSGLVEKLLAELIECEIPFSY